MAEIEIEKKKPVWPWILLAVLIIAAILYFFVFSNEEEANPTEEITTEQVTEEEPNNMQSNNTGNISAVEEYSNYIDDPDMGLDHEYANGALLELITAVQATADNANVDVDADISEAKSKAQDITEDPLELTHADKIKNSGEIIVRALQTIQTQEFPDLQEEFNEVETALGQIQPGQETLNQKDAVKGFFDKAEELLISMK
ncbi:hypothetical protein [Autumnicola musiva]|uniref:Uncharacterized protein n=1 Tax=Autumnicola musiva TaxID=3075589 RepID=A0ABU3D3D0_9FLAO|nr:hypothetical protein [Zunongwangia sp. F117]MDT0675999.1 hypothetical protein [Zunongwangia sp. F117]